MKATDAHEGRSATIPHVFSSERLITNLGADAPEKEPPTLVLLRDSRFANREISHVLAVNNPSVSGCVRRCRRVSWQSAIIAAELPVDQCGWTGRTAIPRLCFSSRSGPKR